MNRCLDLQDKLYGKNACHLKLFPGSLTTSSYYNSSVLDLIILISLCMVYCVVRCLVLPYFLNFYGKQLSREIKSYLGPTPKQYDFLTL